MEDIGRGARQSIGQREGRPYGGRKELESSVEELSQQIVKGNEEAKSRRVENSKTEDKVNRLSYRLIKAQEEERRRIGQELHDTVGGALTLLKLA
ncbi:MAG: histidine kinase, partial [Dehalococcoidia bacterium]